jgi:membrane-bound ClpP family serine protease
MGLDIKIPIGMMFSLFGIILTIFGISTMDDEMYAISIGKNINLLSGIGMLVFGVFMLLISDLLKKKKKGAE